METVLITVEDTEGGPLEIKVFKRLASFLHRMGALPLFCKNIIDRHGEAGAKRGTFSCIDASFTWDETPEGHYFWKGLNDAFYNEDPVMEMPLTWASKETFPIPEEEWL